jgi:integrase
VQYFVGGRRYRESSHSERKADAIKLLRQRLAAADRGSLVTDAAKLTFEDLRQLLEEDYAARSRRSWRRAARAWENLAESFGGWRALRLTTDDLARYVERRRRAVSLATVAYELAILKRAFTVAVERGRLPQRPAFPKLKVENARDEFVEDEEFFRVRDALPSYLRGVATFAWLTGWRVRSEVLPLQWRDVDFEAGLVRLRVGTTKNKEGRMFPFAVWPELEEVLRLQRAYTDAIEQAQGAVIPWVFHRAGRPIRDCYAAWRAACRRAGVLGRDGLPKRLHDFRRSAVRRLERAGVPRSVAMQLVGHKTEAIYRRYAVTREADLAEAVRRVAALTPKSVQKVFKFGVVR